MKCADYFVFKELDTRAKGDFINDKGDKIEYPETYVLKCDEKNDKGQINERKFKFAIQNQTLASKLRKLEAYDRIKIIFDVNIYANGVKLNPIDIEIEDADEE